MKLKTAIYIVETSYAAILLIGFFGLVASFFAFKGATLALAVISWLALIIAAFFVKLNLINFYLKRCKYPYEFLSVLEKLELTEDLQINWSEDLIDGPDKTKMFTQQFLLDNNLITEIGKKKINPSISLLITALSFLGLLYLSQHFSFKDKPLLFVFVIFFGVTNLYLWTKGKRQQNDNDPILRFTEKGLILHNDLYEWNKINGWVVKGQSKNNDGQMKITYTDNENNVSKVVADLKDLNIDRIDFMLLLTHFKAKYGNENTAGNSGLAKAGLTNIG